MNQDFRTATLTITVQLGGFNRQPNEFINRETLNDCMKEAIAASVRSGTAISDIRFDLTAYSLATDVPGIQP